MLMCRGYLFRTWALLLSLVAIIAGITLFDIDGVLDLFWSVPIAPIVIVLSVAVWIVAMSFATLSYPTTGSVAVSDGVKKSAGSVKFILIFVFVIICISISLCVLLPKGAEPHKSSPELAAPELSLKDKNSYTGQILFTENISDRSAPVIYRPIDTYSSFDGVRWGNAERIGIALPYAQHLQYKVLALMISPSSRGDVSVAVRDVITHMWASYLYSLDGRGASLDTFAFYSKTGHCVAFASLAAVLLDSLGIPVRLVSGYASGEFDGNINVVRDFHAHSWLAVAGGAIGGRWFRLDPTPPEYSSVSLSGDIVTRFKLILILLVSIVLILILFILVRCVSILLCPTSQVYIHAWNDIRYAINALPEGHVLKSLSLENYLTPGLLDNFDSLKKFIGLYIDDVYKRPSSEYALMNKFKSFHVVSVNLRTSILRRKIMHKITATR